MQRFSAAADEQMDERIKEWVDKQMLINQIKYKMLSYMKRVLDNQMLSIHIDAVLFTLPAAKCALKKGGDPTNDEECADQTCPHLILIDADD